MNKFLEITKMATVHIHETIEALEKLLDHYTMGVTRSSGNYCPLCKVPSINNNCKLCIWVTKTGKDCDAYLEEWQLKQYGEVMGPAMYYHRSAFASQKTFDKYCMQFSNSDHPSVYEITSKERGALIRTWGRFRRRQIKRWIHALQKEMTKRESHDKT